MPLSSQYIWQSPDWPQFRFSADALVPAISKARRNQGILVGKSHAIGLDGLPAAENDVWVSEAMATAEIEGEKLSLEAVRSSVDRRLGLPSTGPVTVSRNVEGLLDAMADASQNWDQPLTLDRLYGWQAALFPTGYSGLHSIKVGGFRDGPISIMSEPYGKEKVHYEAPPAEVLAMEMNRFLEWFEHSRSNGDDTLQEGLLRAGLAHLWFETLHPFEDGNGRAGRALIDLALAQDAKQPTRLYGISRQLAKARDEYYRYLEKAQKGSMDVTQWLLWFVEQFNAACTESIGILEGSLEKARYWSVHSGISLSPAQAKAIKTLLDAGKGGFEGGMSTSKYASLNKVSTATASRDLSALLKAGMLATTGQGKATRYWINMPGWVPN
jgi:Fic family protein